MRVGRTTPVVALAAAALALAGCTSTTPGAAAPSPTQTAWTEAPTSPASPGAGSTSFDPNGTAEQNRTAFDTAIRGVLAGNAKADGNAVAAALKMAGFPPSATQVTASTTSANLQPGSIMVGVKIGDSCLVGQWGTAVDGYQSTVAPALGTGNCLVGGIAPVG